MEENQHDTEKIVNESPRRDVFMMWGFIIAGLVLTIATVIVPAT